MASQTAAPIQETPIQQVAATSQAAPPEMSHRQIMEALTGLLAAFFTAILSSTIVANALPTIMSDLHGTQTDFAWSSPPPCLRTLPPHRFGQTRRLFLQEGPGPAEHRVRITVVCGPQLQTWRTGEWHAPKQPSRASPLSDSSVGARRSAVTHRDTEGRSRDARRPVMPIGRHRSDPGGCHTSLAVDRISSCPLSRVT